MDIWATVAFQNFVPNVLHLGEMTMLGLLQEYFKKEGKQAQLVCPGSVSSTRALGDHSGKAKLFIKKDFIKYKSIHVSKLMWWTFILRINVEKYICSRNKTILAILATMQHSY